MENLIKKIKDEIKKEKTNLTLVKVHNGHESTINFLCGRIDGLEKALEIINNEITLKNNK